MVDSVPVKFSAITFCRSISLSRSWSLRSNRLLGDSESLEFVLGSGLLEERDSWLPFAAWALEALRGCSSSEARTLPVAMTKKAPGKAHLE